MDDQTRRDLIEYYKWVVNLASLVLTVTLAVAALGGNFYLECSYRIGAILLGVSIFLNWLLVKTLVTLPIVQTEIESGRGGVLHNLFSHGTGWRMQVYGLIQNWSFLVGLALVIYSLVW
jgi:hypothetical protein